MKKIQISLLNFSAILPLTGISVGIEMLARKAGFIGEYEGIIDLHLVILFFFSILLFGIPMFFLINSWLRNKVLCGNGWFIEHITTSCLLYLIIILIMFKWISKGFINNEENGYLLLWMAISFTGILVNIVYLNIKTITKKSRRSTKHRISF